MMIQSTYHRQHPCFAVIQALHAERDAKIAEANQRAATEYRAYFIGQLKELFARHPHLQAVRWHQWWYHKNASPLVGGEEIWVKNRGRRKTWREPDYQGPLLDRQAWELFAWYRSETLLHLAFGCGKRITATRKGVRITDSDIQS